MPEEKTKTTLEMALLKAQGELKNPTNDKVNPHFKNTYTSLGSLLDMVRPVLTKHGLVLVQGTDKGDDGWTLWTHILNERGDQLVNLVPLMPEKSGPQGMGSALTYARRQGICALLGLAGEDDDDGEAAEVPAKIPPKPLDDGGRNIAPDKGMTIDDYRHEISDWLWEMSGHDADGARELLRNYTAFEGTDRETGELTGEIIDTDNLQKMKIGWVKSTHHKVKDAYAEWQASKQ